MARFRFRTRSLFIAIAVIATVAAFLRLDPQRDPALLSVAYGAVIAAMLVQLLIYLISFVRITTEEEFVPGMDESASSEPAPGHGETSKKIQAQVALNRDDVRSLARLLRFRIWTLIVVVMMIGVGLSWIVREAHVQKDAVAAITAAGGSIKYDWEFSNGKITPLGKPRAPGWLVDLVGVDYFGHGTSITRTGHWTDNDPLIIHVGRLGSLEQLNLDGGAPNGWSLLHFIPARSRTGFLARSSPATGAGLIHLKGLARLSELSVRCSELNDTGLLHLSSLTGLRKLDLTNTAITDGGLKHLKGLSKLSELKIGFTSITDAGLVHLEGLTNLSDLELTYTAITDEGLVHLKGLTKLSKLNLFATAVTEAGMKERLRAWPAMTIYR